MESKRKNSCKTQDQDMIPDHDQVSQQILSRIYASLKEKSVEGISQLEAGWMDEIEQYYKDNAILNKQQCKALLEQAYGLLNQKKVWTIGDEELYEMIEKILFLKAREDTFREFFDNMEVAISASLQLDFSTRATLSSIVRDERNMFNYIALSLNILIEKMQTSVVSRKAVNNIFTTLPSIVTIVTDGAGKIRFINEYGENLLDTPNNELINTPVELLFEDYTSIERNLKQTGEIKSIKTKLVTPKSKDRLIPVILIVPKPCEDSSEIDEIVYIIKTNINDMADRVFDLTQEAHDKIGPLNSIKGITSLLKKRFIDAESAMLLNLLDQSAEKLKQHAHEMLLTLTDNSNHYSEYIPIHIESLLDEIIASLSFSDGFNQVEMIKDIPSQEVLFSNPKLLYSILLNVISNAVKYRNKKNQKSHVQITVRVLDQKFYLIVIKDNGIGISQKNQKKIFNKKFRVSPTTEGHGVGLYLVKESVEKLNGEVEVFSTFGEGSLFAIYLPRC